MGKLLYTLLFATLATITFSSCKDEETYAEQKERENNAINDYIFKNNINVITEEQFHEQGNTTDASKNEYVLFESKGVYMQIVDMGCGEKLKDGEAIEVICRYKEYNINEGVLQSTNIGTYDTATKDDVFTVRNNSGSFVASFVKGQMMDKYQSAQVPSGWLIPLTYIKIGRQTTKEEKIARVKIILPHDQGQAYATSNVYACAYDITYMRNR